MSQRHLPLDHLLEQRVPLQANGYFLATREGTERTAARSVEILDRRGSTIREACAVLGHDDRTIEPARVTLESLAGDRAMGCREIDLITPVRLTNLAKADPVARAGRLVLSAVATKKGECFTLDAASDAWCDTSAERRGDGSLVLADSLGNSLILAGRVGARTSKITIDIGHGRVAHAAPNSDGFFLIRIRQAANALDRNAGVVFSGANDSRVAGICGPLRMISQVAFVDRTSSGLLILAHANTTDTSPGVIRIFGACGVNGAPRAGSVP